MQSFELLVSWENQYSYTNLLFAIGRPQLISIILSVLLAPANENTKSMQQNYSSLEPNMSV